MSIDIIVAVTLLVGFKINFSFVDFGASLLNKQSIDEL